MHRKTYNTWASFHDIAQIFLHRQFNLKMWMMWPLTAAGTIDVVKWQHMPLLGLILRWIRQGVSNTALVLINFFFHTGFA